MGIESKIARINVKSATNDQRLQEGKDFCEALKGNVQQVKNEKSLLVILNFPVAGARGQKSFGFRIPIDRHGKQDMRSNIIEWKLKAD